MTVTQIRPSTSLVTSAVRPRRALVRYGPQALMLIAVMVLYTVNLRGYPEYTNDDEGTYYAQAWAVLHKGVMAHYTYWYDHPPLGWVQIAVLLKPVEWLVGSQGVGDPVETIGRVIMGLFAVGSAALMYKIARNLSAAKPVALAVPLVWAICPLTQYFGRQIFLDNINVFWLLVAFALITSKPKLHYIVMAGAAFGVSILSKETAVLAAPALLAAIWVFSWPRTRWFAIIGFLGTAILIASGYLLFAIIKNEVFPGSGHVSLWYAVNWQLHDRAGQGFLFGNGLNNATMREWLRFDPYLLPIGMAFSAGALAVRKLRPLALVPVVYFVMALRGGYVPAMYPISSLPFMALAVVLGLEHGWTALSRPVSRRSCQALVAGLAVAGTALVAPSWLNSVHWTLTSQENEPARQALRYVSANLPRTANILTDDNTWNDLVAMGWNSNGWRGPIWDFKLDKDPIAQQQNLPNGWKDVQYILTGRAMEVYVGTVVLSKENAPLVNSALSHSTLVAAWGPVGRQVRLLKVDPAQAPVDAGYELKHPVAPVSASAQLAAAQTQINLLVTRFAHSTDVEERRQLVKQIQELAKTPGVTVPNR